MVAEMNDLSHIRRPVVDEGAAALPARAGAYAVAALCASEPGERAKNIFEPRGRRKSLKRLKTDKEIQGKPSIFL
jgi:hypothetical protein